MSQALTVSRSESARAGTELEDVAVARIVDALGSRFAHLAAETVAGTVRGEYRRFAQSRIRDYIPILVERAARARLRAES